MTSTDINIVCLNVGPCEAPCGDGLQLIAKIRAWQSGSQQKR